jgi:hypothetical protein
MFAGKIMQRGRRVTLTGEGDCYDRHGARQDFFLPYCSIDMEVWLGHYIERA